MANIKLEIKDQTQAVSFLFNSIARNRLAPVLIFRGPEGVGKFKTALAVSQRLNCENISQNEACGTCGSCSRIEKRTSDALLVIQPSTAQMKLEDIAPVKSFVGLALNTKTRAVIFDQFQTINVQAANSLLKLFEEPPPNTYFILLAPQLSSVLPTIRSRSQVVSFSILSLETLRSLSQEPDWLLKSADGSFKNLSLLADSDKKNLRDQAASLFESFATGQRLDFFGHIKNLGPQKENFSTVILFIQQFVRDSLVPPRLENHSDLKHKWPQIFSFDTSHRLELLHLWVEAERLLNSNIDKNLLLESIFARFHQAS
jgi:hypothetical protein